MKKSIIFLFFSLFIVIYSCDDNSTNLPTGLYWGGTVVLFTETGSTPEDRSGVKIYLEGTNFQTYTRSNGVWRMYNIPAGTFTVVAEKDGFGYGKFVDFEYHGAINNDHFWHVLVGTPTYIIDSLILEAQNDVITITGYPSTTVDYLRFIIIYFGKTDPINDSSQTWEDVYDTRIEPSDDLFIYSFPKSRLASLGFAINDTVHIGVYPGSRIAERYYHPSEDKIIYCSGIGPVPKRINYIYQ